MPNDTFETRIPKSCPDATAEILRHAWNHDLAGLKPLLDVPGRASVQEPTTGETPLHAAIRSCGPRKPDADAAAAADEVVESAMAVIDELFLSGAIWNDVDSNNETPGCVAARLGQDRLYKRCVAAGTSAELLLALFRGYGDIEEDEDANKTADNDDADKVAEKDSDAVDAPGDVAPGSDQHNHVFSPPQGGTNNVTVTSDAYLRSKVTYSDGKLVDDAKNGVMMAWETDIMRRSVDALLPAGEAREGKRILNIGFGMGIIDGLFRDTRPARHHIVEAHPEVLRHIETDAGCEFGSAWEASGPAEGAFKVHAGKWQDVVPALLEQGEQYDAIYFDTFGEDYDQLRLFFTEYVPALLDEGGVFSFFNGLGADRKICYDVYAAVVECHLNEAGLDLEFLEIPVNMQGLEKEGEGEWEGVIRRYWTLDQYLLPIIKPKGC
ncbi:putative arginine N-methyltransferase [Xylariaceae sp. FL0594]|nr:putative arginine N-methyltransferase [Xylariaceae sp. FL0594]